MLDDIDRCSLRPTQQPTTQDICFTDRRQTLFPQGPFRSTVIDPNAVHHTPVSVQDLTLDTVGGKPPSASRSFNVALPIAAYHFCCFVVTNESFPFKRSLLSMSASRANYSGLAGLRNTLYNVFIRRTSIYAMTIVAAGYGASKGMDALTDGVWERANKDKLFKHLQPQIEARRAAQVAAAESEAAANDAESD